MREIIFDTETTGLETGRDRVIEFGGVELANRFPTGRTFHAYFNPQGYPVHPEALAVHGLNDAFLAEKPTFLPRRLRNSWPFWKTRCWSPTMRTLTWGS